MRSFAFNTCIVALAWLALFHLNHLLFSSFERTNYTNWVFLPAALRTLAVMLIGWSGVSGLFIGTFITCDPVLGETVAPSLGIAAMSSFGPMLAMQLGMKLLNVTPDLAGLSARDLLAFAFIGAACTAAMHALFFNINEITNGGYSDFLVMFVGDLIGTAIVLYVASFALKYSRALAK